MSRNDDDAAGCGSATMTMTSAGLPGATAIAPSSGSTAIAPAADDESQAAREGDTAQGPRAGWTDPTRFEIMREVGKGGMATIYLATDRGTNPPGRVALKLMHSHLEADASLVRRFEHEVRSQIGLKHPSIVELVGWGRDGRGQLFMALEYVDGPALKDLLASGRRFPVDLACFVALRMFQGLAAAHARGLVHRDIKPANVMLTLSGEVKVADFGISKSVDMTRLTSTGNVIGTPAYMSPEQALARPLDKRSDLFSVGVTLYEMLVGANPFQTGNPATTLSRVVHHHQRPVFETLPQTPAILEELVDGLLQKDPEKRIDSAEAAIEVLERCIRDEDLAGSLEAMAAFIQEPDATTRRLCQRRGKRCLEAGIRLYAGGKGSVEAAVWHLFLATVLDPANTDARTWLEQVSRERGYSLARKPHPRIDELEATLKDEPDNLSVILQLAKLHKSQGNFLQVIYYYKKAKALRPPDNYTKGQIETLVPSQAATLIEGTGVFETLQGVPVRTRPSPHAAISAPVMAEGWGDFARGVLSTPWGRLAAGIGVAGIMVLAGGYMFDRASFASRRAGGSDAPMAGDALDAQVTSLEQGKGHASRGEHREAEAEWRRFLSEWPDAGLSSEVRFRLGDCLETQGRRPEALDTHADNARRSLDEWGLQSREHRGEILRVDGDNAGARSEYEAVIKVAAGDQRVRALLALAVLDQAEGRPSFARQDLEDAVASAVGTPHHDEARLALADLCATTGDPGRAHALYQEVRDTTDHRTEPFRRASAGLSSLGVVPTAEPETALGSPESESERELAATASDSAAAEPPVPVAVPDAPPTVAEPSAEPSAVPADAGAESAPQPPSTGLLSGLK